ncbi:MAG: OmpP1/FadL family transporter [Salinivirgaceae bacterium]
MKKSIYILIALLGVNLGLLAQNEVDALRYGQFNSVGTARYTAMGGAFGALGADLSAMSNNPAGLGVYRSSQMVFSFGQFNNNAQSNFLGNSTTINEFSLKPTVLGFVVADVAVNNSDWKFINVGFSYNQLQNFNSRFSARGTNTESSLLDYEVQKLNEGLVDEDYSSYYQANVFLWDDVNKSYVNDYQDAGGIYNLYQSHSFSSSGFAGEYNFTVAGNYLDKLYLGGSIGLQQVRYEQVIEHYEEPNNDIALIDFSSEDYLYSKGSGINLKLGFLYKASQELRLGAAIHTPTIYSFSDEFHTDVYAYYIDGGEVVKGVGKAPRGKFNWNYRSPLKIQTSLAYVFGTHGLLSAEYEFINYKGMLLSSENYFFDEENENIRTFYKNGHNIRLGGEYRLGLVNLRAGFTYYGSPFDENTVNKDAHTLAYSGGAGINLGNAFVDLAYQYTTLGEKYFMYNYASSMVELDKIRSTFLLTLGLKF